MNNIIELFRKELTEIALYSNDTIATYISCIYSFAVFHQHSICDHLVRASRFNPQLYPGSTKFMC